MMFVLRLLPLFVMFYVAFRRLLGPARRQYKALTVRAGRYDEGELASFKSDLDGVAIGMGVRAPGIVVVAVPTPTAFAFRERAVDYIAVTPALLEAGLSQAEREAVLAHELAHSVDGDALLEPNAWRGMTGALFILAPLVVLLASLLGGVSPEKLMVMILVPMLLLVIGWPLAIWLLVRPYNLNAMKSLGLYSDVLADSVAVKVTSNPDALKSAIVKLRDLTAEAPRMPSESIGFEHMFIGPLKKWPLITGELLPTVDLLMGTQDGRAPEESPLAHSSNRFVRALFTPIGGPRNYGSEQQPADYSEPSPEALSVRRTEPLGSLTETLFSKQDYAIRQDTLGQMEPFIAWQKGLIAERLTNLDNIEQNRWQAFDLESGRAMVKPSSWE